MTTDRATESDIPEIVSLLRASLGEALMPKSESFWRWKHIENPFGQSPVLVAKDDGRIVGLRAFMRWRWRQNDRIFHAVRAVDTATLPDFQGKGIFKKLTLSLVEECKANGVDFVFNTPNAQSRPGYLKMGWEDAGQLAVQTKILRPFNVLVSVASKGKQARDFGTDNSMTELLTHKGLPALLAARRTPAIATDLSVDYLRWRYGSVPVASYKVCYIEGDRRLLGMAIFRLKPSKFGCEFRIVELCLLEEQHMKALASEIESKARNLGADYITFSRKSVNTDRLPFKLSLKLKGPIVTIRSLQLDKLVALKEFQNWGPSLGDLELF